MRDNRRAVILLAVFGVLVAAFLGVKVLGGGGGGNSTEDADLLAPPVTRPGAGTTTTTLPQAQETFEVFTARNPFRPLVDTTGAGTGSATGTATGTGTSTGTGSATSGSGGGFTTPTTVNSTGSGGSGEPGASGQSGQTVALLEIFMDQGQRTARVRVGSTVYTARTGEHFASNYQVTSLGDRCGDFLFGDSPFSLCVGEEVVK